MAVRGCWLESFSFQYGGPMYLLKFEKALNETVDVVLDHQQDAKKHGQAKGNDILASVRVIGRSTNCLQREGHRTSNYCPFYSVCFLLPTLCQITMEIEGCKGLASLGGYKAVVECLIRLIWPPHHVVADYSCIFMACESVTQ
ncbi:uncharacterized protein LOC119997978 isoform X1 [Tripterygium wilfordii]|uniref:uncharacterized protein LOC119997978 isoform X1 n=1 Tax=Tripterygium wilfordii TaxID=458696 RepID=UPI0018F84262|nr:uncharacterized protein LOC119997978 isoform X1 [Tripterygium wilfordii]XP_038701153.1 uncharacterized protein LOC119997978 isoform X1 [Tripterygium wilfordii]